MQDPIERGISALLAYHNRTHAATMTTVEETDDNPNILNIFTKLRVSGDDRSLIRTNDFEHFSTPLLAKMMTHETISSLERLSGKIDKYAVSIADEIVRDIETATHYPPAVNDPMSSGQLVSTIGELVQAIVVEREKAKTSEDTTST